MSDLIPLIPDFSVFGLAAAPALKRAWSWYRKPSFWPTVVTITRSGKFHYEGGSQPKVIEDWIVVRRKARHRFFTVEEFGAVKRKTAPYVKLTKLRENDEDLVTSEELTEATAHAKRYARALCKQEHEPNVTERAKRLLSS